MSFGSYPGQWVYLTQAVRTQRLSPRQLSVTFAGKRPHMTVALTVGCCCSSA